MKLQSREKITLAGLLAVLFVTTAMPASASLVWGGAKADDADTEPGKATCGDGTMEEDEGCDDGNLAGGDGCAANCTLERPVPCSFDSFSGRSEAHVQTGFFSIPLTISGAQAFRVGGVREKKTRTTSEDVGFERGEMPVVARGTDVRFDPILLPGLGCSCVVQVPDGAGNVAVGRIGCGKKGLDDTDYLTTIDHNTNDDDPDCEAGAGDPIHPGVCNGVPTTDFTGSGPQGSAVIHTDTELTFLFDGGTCQVDCTVADNGPTALRVRRTTEA